jgi:hypothetical protein
MKPTIAAHEAVDYKERPVHARRVSQLTRLDIPGPLAETYADHLDWQQIARLIRRGCPPLLTIRIVR